MTNTDTAPATRAAGVAMAIGAALIFGTTPILGKLSYAGGSNGITLTFLRAALAIPVLVVLLRVQRVPLGIPRRQLGLVALVGIFGPAATTLLLYMSYSYIPVGLATALHFSYPVVVALAEAVLFRQRLGKARLAALALCVAGGMLISGGGQANLTGVILALVSGLTCAFYMLGVEHTPLRDMPPFSLTLYFCLAAVLTSGLFGAVTGQLSFRLTPAAWGLSLVVALFASVGGVTLFQRGLVLVGATATGMLSTLELVTGVALGVLALGERISGWALLGCALVCAGVVLVILAGARRGAAKAAPKAAPKPAPGDVPGAPGL